ncbi:amidohydrolase family protein [Leucobacter ruminantium]|uniref:Amidohydrolase family protein n=1 Tax=Leucobacter ruminantium TaxID=1289170 RepID=A0A939RXI7_9MICO|nr:amidohydrolase family protein [Leucobacter ruminantium]MBO1803916.1 amidohydrolase family protein [Leucobacter ruminantium]
MTSDQASSLTLRNAFVPGLGRRDIDIAAGRIVRVGEPGSMHTAAPGVDPDPGPLSAQQLDLDGYVLLPAPAEPHAHLDKALLGARVRNESEDLDGAITAIIAAYGSMDAVDTERRAREAIRQAVAHGYTAVRTHIDCREGIGARSVKVLVELREQLRGVIDLQVVALAGPVAGTEGAVSRALLDESLRAGADLVGGVPTLESDSEGSLRELLAIAAGSGVGLDLHVDETLDPGARVLRLLAERVIETGFSGGVTASHCVSLSEQPLPDIRETAARVAEAGIGVVALPQTNLYLQGRGPEASVPRGITAISLLDEAGVVVAGGGDNWRDPFNPMGRIDPMETASLLVAAGHRRVADAYARVSTSARSVMGLEPVAVEAGSEASLLAIRAENLEEAVGRASEDRVVISRGRVVARTRVQTEFAPEVSAR